MERVAEAIARAAAEEDGLRLVVVGLPRRLDGTPNEQTAAVTAFVEALRARIPQPVVLQDERLSSVEAESRLALRDRDWRSRKKKLDAAAAAVILQDYLDAREQGPEAGSRIQKTEDRRQQAEGEQGACQPRSLRSDSAVPRVERPEPRAVGERCAERAGLSWC